MPRASTTSDVFNAIAEPRRREIVLLLAGSPQLSVNQLVAATKLQQAAVSKHLAVLRAVGVVTAQRQGKSRLYSLNPEELVPVNDWIKQFEKLWSNQLDRIKARAERKVRERSQQN